MQRTLNFCQDQPGRGIKCSKPKEQLDKVILSKLYTVNHSIAGKNIPSKLIKNLLIETKKNLLAMPSRADKANVTFDYKKDIHLSAVPFAFTYDVEKRFC